MEDHKVLDVCPGVKWIGVLDPDLVTFDVVMETRYGTTYNAYFIDAEHKTVIDTVKGKYWPVFLEKLKQLTDPSDIEYIVVNHTEPDHSGSLPYLLELAPRATLVGSGNAMRYLTDLIGPGFRHKIVKDGETLSLGNKTLQFIGASNLHWPDTIYSYLQEDRVLFSCDSFGCHYCHPEMYDDRVGNFEDAFDYYFKVILKPYSKFMVKAVDKIRGLPVDMVMPGHGPMLRTYARKYIDLSYNYALEALKYPFPDRVLIAYVSAYKNTSIMAGRIAEGIREAAPQADIDILDLEHMPLEEVERHINEAGAILLGSPLINQNILLQLYQVFALLNPIRDRGKLAGAFGSYGWSGEFTKILEQNLSSLKLNFVGEGVFVKFTPKADDLERCFEYGMMFGRRMTENTSCSEDNTD